MALEYSDKYRKLPNEKSQMMEGAVESDCKLESASDGY